MGNLRHGRGTQTWPDGAKYEAGEAVVSDLSIAS